MSRKLILSFLLVLTVSFLSYQRSKSIHYSYQISELEKEIKGLENRLRSLQMEVRSRSTPEILYHHWKNNCAHLDFTVAPTPEPQPSAVLAHYRQ